MKRLMLFSLEIKEISKLECVILPQIRHEFVDGDFVTIYNNVSSVVDYRLL
jgi:hypothetical protein